MATFLLVHGAWHGAWCWERLVPALATLGHRAVAIDLPGHGAHPARPIAVTLGRYARAIRAAAAAEPEPPIAVGHSFGGVGVTQAAHDDPSAFAALVYLCAFAPLQGESLVSLGRRDRASRVPASVVLRPTAIRIRPERAREVFYADLGVEDARRAAERLSPEPLFPMLQRVSGRCEIDLPRAYIECTQDRAISIERQRAMAARHPLARVVTMETSHSPFLSAPGALARHLDALSALAP
jgi:pimeloyl-ACP methyl ester carboxylesterase